MKTVARSIGNPLTNIPNDLRLKTPLLAYYLCEQGGWSSIIPW